MYIYNPNTWETEAGKLAVQGQPQLHRMFEASKGYMKLNKQKVNLYKSSDNLSAPIPNWQYDKTMKMF